MTINSIKSILADLETIAFELAVGSLVPTHLHLADVGKVSKDFIDCGGVRRQEVVANFQLWNADDYDHRLHPGKLISIIEMSQKVLDIGDLPIEVEYQGSTIGKFGLDFNGKNFILTNKHTDCLAKDNCGVPEPKVKVSLGGLPIAGSCTPGSGCC